MNHKDTCLRSSNAKYNRSYLRSRSDRKLGGSYSRFLVTQIPTYSSSEHIPSKSRSLETGANIEYEYNAMLH